MMRTDPPLACWEAGDLVRRLCRALGVANQVVGHLAANGYDYPGESANKLHPGKIISETGLLLLAASTCADSYPAVHARIEGVAGQLVRHARSERIIHAICLEPALALDHAYAHICLSRIGYPDKAFDALLDMRSQAGAGKERPPHRMLERSWSADLRAGARPGVRRNTGAIVKSSLLNLPMDLLDGNRDDMYAFTHALMYCARFGQDALPLPRARGTLLAEAAGALAKCLDAQDYDLAGEMLLAWPLTGKTWGAAATFGFHVLARVEDAAGFLPTPSTRLDGLDALSVEARKNYLLATSYHTIYVMGLLCASALVPGRAPPAKPATTGHPTGVASRIVGRLDERQPIPHWRQHFDLLAPAEQDALASFVLDVALLRSARRRDFDGLHRLLELACAEGLANSPVASQVAEMLGRLAFSQQTWMRAEGRPAGTYGAA